MNKVLRDSLREKRRKLRDCAGSENITKLSGGRLKCTPIHELMIICGIKYVMSQGRIFKEMITYLIVAASMIALSVFFLILYDLSYLIIPKSVMP